MLLVFPPPFEFKWPSDTLTPHVAVSLSLSVCFVLVLSSKVFNISNVHTFFCWTNLSKNLKFPISVKVNKN